MFSVDVLTYFHLENQQKYHFNMSNTYIQLNKQTMDMNAQAHPVHTNAHTQLHMHWKSMKN